MTIDSKKKKRKRVYRAGSALARENWILILLVWLKRQVVSAESEQQIPKRNLKKKVRRFFLSKIEPFPFSF